MTRREIDYSLFVGQYALSEDSAAPGGAVDVGSDDRAVDRGAAGSAGAVDACVAGGWQRIESDGWTLAYCPTLPMHEIFAADGTRVGALLGLAVTPQGELVSSAVTLADGAATEDSSSGDAAAGNVTGGDTVKAFEQYVSQLAGRFVAVLITPTARRVYFDPCGQFPAVYNAAARRVGASPCLVADDAGATNALAARLNVRKNDVFFPFGCTSFDDVERLLPNHYLDLMTTGPVRHWPMGPIERIEDSDDAAIENLVAQIAEKTAANLAAVAGRYPVYLSLTAGRDSRMLLAAARPVRERVRCFLARLPDDTAAQDQRVAKKIAARAGLELDIFDEVAASEEQLELWQLRTGYCVGGRTNHIVATMMQIEAERVFLPGLCGEIGRAYYWKEADFAADRFSAGELVSRLKVPAEAQFVEGAKEWIDNLPSNDVFETLDLLYIEQRLGCWAGPTHFGHVGNLRMLPLSDRAIIGAMLRLPARYRFDRRLARDMIGRLWPELLRYPFNRDTGLDLPRYILRRGSRKALRAIAKRRGSR